MRALVCVCVLTILSLGTTVSYAQTTIPADPMDLMPIRLGPIGLQPDPRDYQLRYRRQHLQRRRRPPERLHDDGHPPPPGADAGRQDAAVGCRRDRAGLLPGVRRRAVHRLHGRGACRCRSRVVSALRSGFPARHAGAAQRRAGCARPTHADDARRRHPLRAVAEDRARVRCSKNRARVRRGDVHRRRVAQPDAQLAHQDHRKRPGAVPDAAHDVRRHRVAPDRSLRRVSRARRRHAQNSAVDSHGGARHHSGHAVCRLPSLHAARPADTGLQRTRGQRIDDAHVRRADEGGSHALARRGILVRADRAVLLDDGVPWSS